MESESDGRGRGRVDTEGEDLLSEHNRQRHADVHYAQLHSLSSYLSGRPARHEARSRPAVQTL